MTVFGAEVRIGRVAYFEAGGEQTKMADDELVAMDLPWEFLSVQTSSHLIIHEAATSMTLSSRKCCDITLGNNV